MFALCALHPAAASPPPGRVSADRGFLILETGDRRLASRELIGASLLVSMFDEKAGQERSVEVRIDAVAEAIEAPGVMLHTLSIASPDGTRQDFCSRDRRGRNAAYALGGRLSRDGRFVPDPTSFFFACTSGAVGKCVLWGYDPWAVRPTGRSLLAHYSTCLRAARADYRGDGMPHTREGTIVDLADDLGLRRWSSLADPRFSFEAGWTPDGAVCLGRARWPDLVTKRTRAHYPNRLKRACTFDAAKRDGALLFTRVLIDPGALPLNEATPTPGTTD